MKKNLSNFKTDINFKLNKIDTDMKNALGRLDLAEQRMKKSCQSLDLQQKMQPKLMDPGETVINIRLSTQTDGTNVFKAPGGLFVYVFVVINKNKGKQTLRCSCWFCLVPFCQ